MKHEREKKGEEWIRKYGERLRDKKDEWHTKEADRFFPRTCKTTDHVAPYVSNVSWSIMQIFSPREVRGFSDTDGKTGHALHVYGFEFELSGWMPGQSNPCLWVSLNSTFHDITPPRGEDSQTHTHTHTHLTPYLLAIFLGVNCSNLKTNKENIRYKLHTRFRVLSYYRSLRFCSLVFSWKAHRAL